MQSRPFVIEMAQLPTDVALEAAARVVAVFGLSGNNEFMIVCAAVDAIGNLLLGLAYSRLLAAALESLACLLTVVPDKTMERLLPTE